MFKCNVLNCGDGKCIHKLLDERCPLCNCKMVEVTTTGFKFCSNHESICSYEIEGENRSTPKNPNEDNCGGSEFNDELVALTEDDVYTLQGALKVLTDIAQKRTLKENCDCTAIHESRFKKATINDASESAKHTLSGLNKTLAKVMDIVQLSGGYRSHVNTCRKSTLQQSKP